MTPHDLYGVDERSKSFVLVPFCLICQAFQAQGIVRYGYRGTIKPIIEEILRHDINIIQMACPESQFGGYEYGLKRGPKSINQYSTEAFKDLCRKIALQTADMIRAILSSGYEIVAILGIEYSPSCSINLQYSNRGSFRQPGIFIGELQEELNLSGINIPFLGINRRGLHKSLKELQILLTKQGTLL